MLSISVTADQFRALSASLLATENSRPDFSLALSALPDRQEVDVVS